MGKVLVTGGLGYIGSHTVRVLRDNYDVAVLDNLSKGHIQSIPKDVHFYQIDLANKKALDSFFEENDIDSVIHFAGFIEAGESMINPKIFYQNNVINTLNLLDSMLKFDTKRMIFSSTAAIFDPSEKPISEEGNKKPANVYGKTKLIIEETLKDYDSAYGLKSVCLRYFNAAGAGFDIGEDHNPESHLIPLVLQVPLAKRKEIKVFGTDYPTPDGTCIRDYIHVLDLADAHILALQQLKDSNQSDEYNLGSERGYSVMEIIEMARKVTGFNIPFVKSERRTGDASILIADSTKAKKKLKWNLRFSLEEIISSAWQWHSQNPEGFKE